MVESPQGLDWLSSLRTTKGVEVEAPEEEEEVQALRAELEKAQTVKEKFKSAALKIRKENAELRDVNIATTSFLITINKYFTTNKIK